MNSFYVKVAAAALNQTPLAWRHNTVNAAGAIADARLAGVSILCLPEQCIGGYNQEDWYQSRDGQARALKALKQIIPLTKGMVVCVGLPLAYRNSLFNVVAVIADGKLLGFVAKQFLANDGIHYEERWFVPWPKGVRAHVVFDGHKYPLGDIYFNVGGVRIGFEICEDAWVAERPGAELALRGVDVILNPSASHFAFGKIDTREQFVIDGSRRFGVTYIYANLLGNESGRAIYDGTCLIASDGELAGFGERFSFKDRVLTTAVVNIDRTRTSQMKTASRVPILTEEEGECVSVLFHWPKIKPALNKVRKADWELSANRKEEEFARAEILGLFDYMRKTRARGFVNSLSGGVDSSVVAGLVHLMVKGGVAELGVQGFLAKLAYLNRQEQPAPSVSTLTNELLTCVYQATENSGPVTLEAARQVAAAVGARYLEFDVDKLVKGYVRMVGKAIKRKLTWQTDDIALQNIQARVRAPGAWMLANIFGQILISTSNRSEATKGYCTMDGDTAGGLAPLAGIDKTFLRQWLLWLEKTGPLGLGPIPAMSYVNAQQPTAELRPQECKQTDEDDLGPYIVGDALEAAAIRDKMSPEAGFRLISEMFPQYRARDLATWTEKFFRLWCSNQWKRERMAPSFHLDDHNVDPKTGCRFPILSAGYLEELEEMWTVASEFEAAQQKEKTA
jgi:NAD+ synthase (glutamine-hydrolysing)